MTSRHDRLAQRASLFVTGGAGRVATALRPHLREHVDLTLFDRVEPRDVHPHERVVVGDLSDYAHVRDAMTGTSAVLHLACVHGLELTFDASIDANFRGTMHVLDAALEHGIARHVYTSSHHVLGLHEQAGFDATMPTFAPDGHYALGKAFGELAYRGHALRHAWDVLVIRVGNAAPVVPDARALRMWVSARDLAQLVLIGLTANGLGYAVVYGVSNTRRPLFDNRRANELGYAPRDWAEEHLASDFVAEDAMPVALGGRYVGGAYAATQPTRSEGSV